MNEKNEHRLPRQANYQISFDMARNKLMGMDFDAQCRKAGVEATESGTEVPLLGRAILVDRKTCEVSVQGGGKVPEPWEGIIALHYLITADGSSPRGELITYKQVPDGMPYYDVFNRRTGGILLSVFGERLPALLEAARRMGAEPVSDHGDLAFKIRALPRVEYIFVCYRGDDEFPPEIRVLFDSSITGYLPAEDITVLCQMACIALVRAG